MNKQTRKLVLLVCLFSCSFWFSLCEAYTPVRASNQIPTITQNINGYEAIAPDWNRITWSNLPPTQTPGAIEFPANLTSQLGYDPSRAWASGTSLDKILKLGDIGETGVSQFALEQISSLGGVDLSNLSLDDLKLMNWQTISSLAEAIPGLESIPIDRINVFSDLLSQVGRGNLASISGKTVGEVMQIVPQISNIPLGQLDLTRYSLTESIPGVNLTAIESFKDAGNSFISQIPGLNSVPFSQFPTGFGLGIGQVAIADTVFGKSEYADRSISDGDYVTGETQGFSTIPKSCPGGKPCAYFNLSDITGSNGPFYGKRWASGETQQVEGGYGALKVINGGKEPTGRLVYGDLFKVAIVSTDESRGTARTGIYFRVCVRNAFVDLGCSPYSIGPIPWIPMQEDQLVVMGGTAPAFNIPFNYQQQMKQIIAQYTGSYPSGLPLCTANNCPQAGEANALMPRY